MNNAIHKEKVEIGNRARKLRELLSLSRKELEEAVDITEQTIMSIEAGKGFTGDYILAISHFFGMNLSELASVNSPLPDEVEFREKLEALHKKQNPKAYKVLIENTPTLKVIIRARLIKSAFLKDHFRGVQEINEYLKVNYSISFKSSILSQALSDAVNAGLLEKIEDGKNHFYKVRKK